MSTLSSDLNGLSQALVELVGQTAQGVVAAKTAPHRVVSGVSIRENLIAIADHTLRRQENVSLQTSDGKQGTGTLVGRDPSTDLAFLKTDDVKLKTLATCDPATLTAGALAVVVGLTMDAGPSASLGILGAVGEGRRTWRGGTLDQFVRLDVNVYPSQSGAAVVNAQGALIGLATPALLRHSSVAIPVATLTRVADELLRQGRIRQGFVGVGLQPVAIPSVLREKIGITQESGLIVLSVEEKSPAEQAGWQLGDILLELNGRPTTHIEEMQSALRGDAVGQTVRARLLRGGEPADTQVTIAERTTKGR